MIHCSEISELEDFVLGTLSPRRSRELRAHLGTCRECQREERLLVRERELFARREELGAPLPATVAAQLRERLDVEAAEAPVISGGRFRRLAARGVAVMGAFGACGAMWALLHGGAPTAAPSSAGAATRLEGPRFPIASHAPAPVPRALTCDLPSPPPPPPPPPPDLAPEQCKDAPVSRESRVETYACVVVAR